MVRFMFNKVLLLASLFALNGCNKLVTVPPPVTELSSQNVYSSNSTAAAVLTGFYIGFTIGPAVPSQGGAISRLSLEAALSADELTVYGAQTNSYTNLVQFYQNNLTGGAPNSDPISIWADCYGGIHQANQALENLAVSDNLNAAVRQQLTGEAKFLRAFFYFYLVNLYGPVPLAVHSDYAGNVSLSRAPQAEVYQQIISDLLDAQDLLSGGYVAADAETPTGERVRPTKWAAKALLARSYLFDGNYDSAELEASAIIENTTLFDTVPLNQVFLKNSAEAIWQIQPVNLGWNTPDAQIFILPSAGPTTGTLNPVYLSSQLLSAFEPDDRRRANWVDSTIANGVTYYYPYKYKSATYNAPLTEYEMIFRLGEQYLIRAEARAWQNNIPGARADLNVIRSRAGLPNSTANDEPSLLSAIAHERQVELFTEWGHRWLDLKRTKQVDSIMGMPVNVCAQKGGAWRSDWQWYPLPTYDIIQDPHLTQNGGY